MTLANRGATGGAYEEKNEIFDFYPHKNTLTRKLHPVLINVKCRNAICPLDMLQISSGVMGSDEPWGRNSWLINVQQLQVGVCIDLFSVNVSPIYNEQFECHDEPEGQATSHR